MKIGLTFGKKMLMSYLFVLSMMVTIGMMAYCAMNSMARKMDMVDATNRCLILFRAVERSEHQQLVLSEERAESVERLASNDWKKAQDKFLAEVKKLSQIESLGEQEREIINTITESWKEYEVSFQRYILALNGRDNSNDQHTRMVRELQASLARSADAIVEHSEKLANLAKTSANRVQAQMVVWLIMAIATAVGLGLMIMLVNIHVWSRALGRAINRLGKNSSRISTASTTSVSEEDLKSQAQQIRQTMSELMELLGSETTKRDANDDVKSTHENA